MVEVVINACHGGFSLSRKAIERLREMGSETAKAEDLEVKHFSCEMYGFDFRYDKRTDPQLIAVVKELGKDANGACAALKIVEVPDDVEWTIEEYDGWEHVAEVHRTWG